LARTAAAIAATAARCTPSEAPSPTEIVSGLAGDEDLILKERACVAAIGAVDARN
jgi:hypothetical protein